MGIEIPFQGLILRLDGAFEGLDTEVEQGGTRANVRQVSIVVSLGIANANTGGNITSSETNQGNSVNGLQAGDALAVLALDENGNIIGTGDAAAGNNDIVVVSLPAHQRRRRRLPGAAHDDHATSDDDPCRHDADDDRSGDLGDEQHDANRLDDADDDGPAIAPPPDGPSGFGHVPRGTLPATGVDAVAPLAIGALTVLIGGVILLVTRRRIYE